MEFRDFWYIVAESKQLKPEKVLARKVLGEWLAVFRDEKGKAVVVQDRCKHRLSCPKVKWKMGALFVPITGGHTMGRAKWSLCRRRERISSGRRVVVCPAIQP